MAGPADLHDAAQEFLDACEAALDTIPILEAGLGGSPPRVFVSPGAPAHDCCDQLTVHVGPLGEGAMSPLQPKASHARINRVTFIATALRCVPVPSDSGKPPSTIASGYAAEQINADKWALWNHIYNLIRAKQLFTLCGDVEWLGLAPLPLSGGCGGSTLTIRAALDGYEEVIST